MSNIKIREATIVTPNADTIIPASNGSGNAVAVTIGDIKTFLGRDTIDWADVRNKPHISEVGISGRYEDLANTPTIGDGTVAITQGGMLKGKFSLNQKGDTFIDLELGGGGSSVQSDWAETLTTANSYIRNKPTIPTRTSQLINDSGFINNGSLEVADNVEESSGKAVSGDAVYRFVMKDLAGKTFVFTDVETGEEKRYTLTNIE